MANDDYDCENPNLEITSKRRQGFPSETQVKRGVPKSGRGRPRSPFDGIGPA
jgi:hypothetical protein